MWVWKRLFHIFKKLYFMKKYLILSVLLLFGILVSAQDCNSIRTAISSYEQLISNYERSESQYSSDINNYCPQRNNSTYRSKCDDAKNMLSKVRLDISNANRKKSDLERQLRDCKNK